jgi:predicted MPP superfamily phosphohydrolase
LRSRGLRVLHNEAVSLRARPPVSANGPDAGAPLCLIGVDDKSTTDLEYNGYSMNFSLALARCAPDAKQVVYLVHQPSAAYKSLVLPGADRVRVVLIGHTHAGQVWPFSMLIHVIFKATISYFHGLYENIQHENQFVYVSPGTDCGFPFKLGAPKEITVFTVRIK